MCEFCEEMKPLVKFGCVDNRKIEVETYIEKSYRKDKGIFYYTLTTNLNVDGYDTGCGIEIHFCPKCGRRLVEE